MSKKKISEILKERRKQLKLDAKFVCEQLGTIDDIKISPSTLYGYENGHRTPNANVLLALCDLYDLDNMLVTFGFANHTEEADFNQMMFAESEREEKLLETFDQLNDEGQEEAQKRISELAELPRYQKNHN